MSKFVLDALYYLNADSVDFWLEWKYFVPYLIFINLMLVVLANCMKVLGNFPEILNEFPFAYCFPMRLSAWAVWTLGWAFMAYLPTPMLRLLSA